MLQYPETEYCTFLYPDGRRCRTLKMPTREVCIGHWRKDGDFTEDEAAVAELAVRCQSLRTPAQVNRALACLIRLTVLGKIPHRKATLASYQFQLMLYAFSQGRGQHPMADPSEFVAPDAVPVTVPEIINAELDSPIQLPPVKAGSNGSNGGL